MAKSNSTITGLDDSDVAVADPVEVKAVVGSNHDSEVSGDRKTITIHPTEGDGGSDAVFVGLNGYAYQIPRGTPQSIPVEVLEIIKNAKTTHLVQAPGGAIIERVVQRFAFSVE